MSRGRAWESVFSKSWMIWILWGDLYRPLLNLPATFLNSMVFIFPFPCYHLYYSSDSRDFLIFLIMSEPGHIYCFSYTSCPCPQQYPVNEATEPEISQPSTHPFLFWFGFSPHTTASSTLPQGSTGVPCLLHPLAFLFSPPSDHLHLLFTLLRTSSRFPCS